MSFTSQVIPEYADNVDAPLSSVTVTNPSGYRNLKISVDTKGGRKHARTRRFKIENSKGQELFLAESSLDSFVEALERLQDFGVDGASS